MEVHHPYSRGQTQESDSVAPNRGATLKRGSSPPQVEGPHRDVGPHHGDCSGHTKRRKSISPSQRATPRRWTAQPQLWRVTAKIPGTKVAIERPQQSAGVHHNELGLTAEDMSRLINDNQISILHMCAAGLVPHACIIEQHRMNKRLTNFINTFFCRLMVGLEDKRPLTRCRTIPAYNLSTHLSIPNLSPVDNYLNRTCAAFRPPVANSAFSTIAARHVNDVLHHAKSNWPKCSVAIISNTYEQNRLNKAVFSSHESVSAIDTMGRFQGSQADVVILTLASMHPRFFTETTRQYVACWRACPAIISMGEIARW